MVIAKQFYGLESINIIIIIQLLQQYIYVYAWSMIFYIYIYIILLVVIGVHDNQIKLHHSPATVNLVFVLASENDNYLYGWISVCYESIA